MVKFYFALHYTEFASEVITSLAVFKSPVSRERWIEKDFGHRKALTDEQARAELIARSWGWKKLCDKDQITLNDALFLWIDSVFKNSITPDHTIRRTFVDPLTWDDMEVIWGNLTPVVRKGFDNV